MNFRWMSLSFVSSVALLSSLAGCDYSVTHHNRPVLGRTGQDIAAPAAPASDVGQETAQGEDEVIPPATTGTENSGTAEETPPQPAPPSPPTPSCAPKVCGPTTDGDMCGVQDDGCGHSLDCGDCGGSETCGGGGIANVCGATATLPPSTPPTTPPTPHHPNLPGAIIGHPDVSLGDLTPVGPMSPADVDAIDNLKINIMVPNFSDAEAKRVGLIFCPTANFAGPDCIKTRLETATTSYMYRGTVNSFYLLREESVSSQAAAIIDEGRMGELHLSSFKYFRFYPLGTGSDNTLLIGGVELSAKPKGASEWVTVYRNPCVNRMLVAVDGDMWGPGYTRKSDHSLTDDQVVCVFVKTGSWKDAGTGDTISIEVPLSQALDTDANNWLNHSNNNYDDTDTMALHYDEDRGAKVQADLKWNQYKAFADGSTTSYGFTIFKSEGRLQGYYRLKTNGDDALDFTKLEVYQFNPGDPAFLMNQKCLGKVYGEDQHLGSLSEDGDEGTTSWPFQFDKLSEMTSSQFHMIGWGTTATAFGVK